MTRPTENAVTNYRPPANIEAEQALLGALLINNAAAEYVQELEPEHFFDPTHGAMFHAMNDALLEGRPFTATTLADKFRHVQIDRNTNGAQYLGRLMVNATTIVNVREYARTIMEAAQRRALIVLAEDLANRAHDQEADPSGLVEEAERRLFLVSDRGKSGNETDFSEAIQKAMKSLADRIKNPGHVGLSTGFTDLDAKLGGLSPSDLLILAGRPSMGKTALALNIASNVAQQGEFVHFFSLEMSDEQLAARELADQSGVASEKLRRGDVTEDEYRSALQAAKRLSGLPMRIDVTGGISIAALSAKARRLKRKRDTGLIVVDYLQLMTSGGKGSGNRVAEITDITTGLKALAKDLNVPIIALSQLNRSLESRNDKRPMLSDLRESGSIEQDADVVMFVYRDEYYLERAKPNDDDMQAYGEWQRKMASARGKAEVIIGKQRHGPVGSVEMAFDGARTRFSDLAREPEPTHNTTGRITYSGAGRT